MSKAPTHIKVTAVQGGAHTYIPIDIIGVIAPTSEGTKVYERDTAEGHWHVRETVGEILDQVSGDINKLPTSDRDEKTGELLPSAIEAGAKVAYTEMLTTLNRIKNSDLYCFSSGSKVLDLFAQDLEKRIDALK